MIYYLPFYSNGYLGTPLACAAYYGHDHIVKYLFSHDVYCNGSYAELQVLTQPMHTVVTVYPFVCNSDVSSVTGHSTRSLKSCEELVGSSEN